MKALGVPAEVIDMKDYDPDDQLADEVRGVPREDALAYGPRYEQPRVLKSDPKPLQDSELLRGTLEFHHILLCS